MSVPKAERIVQEFIRRLKGAFPRVHLERGFYGEKVTIFPSMYLFEAPEDSLKDRLKQKGMYKRILPLVLTYFVKGGDTQTQAAERAAVEVQKLYAAIEQDELFDGLVNDYSVTETIKLVYLDNAVQIAVTYVFHYGEYAPWWGNQKRRK